MSQRRDVYTAAELRRLLAPASIAVVGASPQEGAFGWRTVDNLRGFAGRVYPVNPRYEEVLGRPCFASLARLPEPPDCVVIAVPRERVEPVVEEAAAVGAGGAIVYASGYAETRREDRRREQERLRAIAESSTLRIIGPNCLGVVNHVTRAGMTFMPDYDRTPAVVGPVGIASQSGAIGYAFVQGPERGVGFTYYVAAGNSCDVDVCDFVSYLADDPGTLAIACLFEGIRDGERLLRAAERALATGTIVVAYKMTGGEASQRAAMSHTGTLVGSDAAYRAAFARGGIVAVADLEAVLETAVFFAKAPAATGRGPAVMVTSGGAGVIAAAKAEAAGLPLPQPDAATEAILAAEIPDFGSTANPCDITGQVLTNPESFSRCLRVFLDHPDFGALVVPVAFAHTTLSLRRLPQIQALSREYAKPLCMVWMTEWLEGPASREYESDERVALFRSMGRCMGALAAWYERARFLERRAGASPRRAEPDAATRARAVLDTEPPGATLTERASKTLLAAYGVPVTRERLATDVDAAVAAARAIGFPVALKVESPDIPHKTEAGVIRLDVRDEAAVEAAWADVLGMVARLDPPPRLHGVLVSGMVPRGTELVVGARVDPQFGPLVAVGLGGVLVEVLQDTAVGLAPVGPGEAREMIGRLKGGPLLRGHRGAMAVDLDQLVDVVCRVSELVADLQDVIAEIDVNPMIASPRGLVAVDALIVRRGGPPGDPRSPRPAGGPSWPDPEGREPS
jgi:acyl-CoA synthetase (NDP forming)